MDFIPSIFRPNAQERVRSVEDGVTDSQTTAIGAEDKLAIFRHLVGIHSTKEFAPTKASGLPDLSHNNLHFDGRAAPNLGIYNRVVHREQQSKRGYKFASALINSCLGIQVVVAAALTALGAANSSHRAVTAFGAINTVIAGILTYLKGSGLPNRIRYYENEWKRIREYIEQRERDFSRPDCKLDVYEIVRIVEGMYEEVKVDIQSNTPDNYVSVGEIRNKVSASMHPIPRLPGVNDTVSHSESKLKELELKYGHKVADFLEGLARKEEDRLKALESELEGRKSGMLRRGEEIEKEIEAKGARIVELEKGVEKDIEAKGSSIVELKKDAEKDFESRSSRLVALERNVEKEAAERRHHLSRIGRELSDEMHIQRRD